MKHSSQPLVGVSDAPRKSPRKSPRRQSPYKSPSHLSPRSLFT